ncbi:amidase [Mesorhizobium koreense]|uniref:amidase n=1 Tax=Mesorhizobium koreense TaxID=3074855 RepID=UPI00287B7EF0|nr:amidase [Mesorhizobium sp. WR6]
MELWQLGIAETTAGYRGGKFTPEDVLDETLERLAKVNPILNAVVTEDEQEARQLARQSTLRWKTGTPRSALDGVFITVKDNIPVRGLRCTWGSRTYADYVPERDEWPIARLRDAGVGILGKTNVPEFTLQGYTDNLVFGATGNPWNPDLTPGGSSGGAVAAVASGIGVAAMATDGGGSIRRPSAHTGLYGLKPSPGLVSRIDGLPPLLGDFETMGVIARSPGDLRAILFTAAHRHPADRPAFAFSDEERRTVPAAKGRQRILYVPRFGDFPVDPEIGDSVDGAARLLERMGHSIEMGEVPFDVDRLNAIWNLIGPAGLAWLVDSHSLDTSLMSPSLLPMVETGRKASATAYLQLLADVQSLRNELVLLFEHHDFILTPSVAALPWPKSQSHPETIDGVAAGPRGHAVFTPFVNAGGLPAINLPTAPSAAGLPIGCQLVGPFRSDLLLVSLAEAYAEEFGPYAWPDL